MGTMARGKGGDLVAVALITGVLWMANRLHIYRRAQLLLPAAIETTGLVDFGSRPGQLECNLIALLFTCESHGAVILRLSRGAADDMQKRGLEFFAGAERARGVLNERRGPAVYEPWRPTPLPREWSDEASGELWGSLYMLRMDGDLHAEVVAARNAGAFYTRKVNGGGSLVVIPEKRLVIYAWRD